MISNSVYAEPGSGNQYHLLFSTRSGRTMLASPEISTGLKSSRVPDDPRMIELLRSAEMVVDGGGDEFDEVQARNRAAVREQRTATLTISPTAFCNMACSYCGQSHSRDRISEDVADGIVRRAAAAAQRSTRLHITWFGGEPLAVPASLKTLSTRLMGVADNAGVVYSASIVTNGSLLSHRLARELAGAHGIGAFTITVDGPADAHNRSRPMKNGRDSYGPLMRTLQACAHDEGLRHARFTIRTNVSRLNADALPGFFASCADLGLGAPNFSFELSPVYEWSNDVSAVKLGRAEYAILETRLMHEMLDHGLRFPALPESPHPITCVAVDPSAEAIDHTGSIFSCTEHLLTRSHATDRLGDVSAPSKASSPFWEFNGQRLTELPCSRCEMFGICGGACPKHWDEGLQPCPSYKDNMQARLDITAARAGLVVV